MERRRIPSGIKYLIGLLLVLSAAFARADQPWSTSVDGRLFQGGTTTPLRDSSLVFTLQIMNPSRNCVLYEESQTYDTHTTNGYFNLRVGSRAPDLTGKRTSGDPGYSMARIFNNTLNSFPATTKCPGGYTPDDGDARFLRVTVKPTAGVEETLAPDIALTSVPSAKVAETVGGLDRSQILNVNNTGINRVNMTNLESVFNTTQLPILTALLGGTSSLYMRQGSNGTAVVPGLSGNASGASAGQIWYDTASNQLKYQSNSGPQTLGVAGAGISSVTAGTGLNVGAGPGGSITTSGTLNVNVGTGDGQIVQVQTGGKLPALNASDLTNVNGSAIQSGTIGGTTSLNTSGNLTTTGTLNSGAITSSGNVAGVNLTATNSVTANDARLNALRVYKPSTANYVEFVADGALNAPVVFTLPTALGTNGQVLQTDASGKLSWTTVTTTIDNIRGNPVAAGTLAVGDAGKVYRWSGTQFEAVNFGVDDLRTEAGLQQFAANCGADQTLTWSTITDAFACTTIGIAGTQITSGTINAARLPTIDPTKGGTGLTALGTSNQVLGVNNAGSAMEYKSITGGAGVTITHSAGGIQVSATGSGGTVTNVTGSAPISVTSNSSTPAITISQANTSTDGYLSSADWNTFNSKQPAGNYVTALTGDVVAAGPGSATATIQANAITTGKINNLAVTDAKINDVAWSKITGVPALLSAVNTAGTGNQVFGMNAAGSAGEYKSITGGAGVTITHSVNGIEVSATGSGGTVTGVTAGTGLNVGAGPGGTINGSGTLNIDVGTTTGKIVQVAASNKLPIIDGSNLTNLNASNISSGTLAIAQGGTGQTTANGALNALLPSQALNSGKVLQTNGTDTSWVTPNAGTVTNVTGTAPISVTSNTTTPSITIAQANTTTSGYLSSTDWNTFNNKASTTALNSYVLKAGDTMTGALNLPSNGIAVGTNQLVVSGGNVGIGTNAPGATLDVAGTVRVTAAHDGGYAVRSDSAPNAVIANLRNAYGHGRLEISDSNGVGAVSIGPGNGSWPNFIYGGSGLTVGGSALAKSALDVAGGVAIGSYATVNAAPANGLIVSGNVGIGTNSPIDLLDVYSATNNALMGVRSGSNSYWALSAQAASNDMAIGPLASAHTVTPILYLKSGGNVGVGTTNPTELLDVAGKVKGTELCIGADCRAAWPTGAGGSVTSVTSANADIAVATTTTTPVLTLNTGTGANQIVKLNASSQLPAVSGANLTNLNASNLSSGTVPTAQLPTVPVSKGGTGSISFTANRLIASDGTGASLIPFNCAPGEVVKFDASGVLGCSTIATMLGYTPANGANYVTKAGDTMTGALALPSNGLTVGTNQLTVNTGNVGIGTASPVRKLHVIGSSGSASQNAVEIDVSSTGGLGYGGTIELHQTDSTVGNVTGIMGFNAGGFATAGIEFVNQNHGGAAVRQGQVSLFTLGNGGVTNRMIMNESGNVGIGTTSPGQKLSVAGVIESTTGGVKFPDGTVQTTATTNGVIDGYTNSSISGLNSSSQCPTFVDVPSTSKSVTFAQSGTVVISWNTSYYTGGSAGAATFRVCVGAVCGGDINTYSNEGNSHKLAGGHWTPNISAGTYTVKLQACSRSAGVPIQNDWNDGVSWAIHAGTGAGGGGAADNLGNHTATQNVNLGSNWLSGDGTAKGIRIDSSGNVGVGKVPTAPLDIVGDVKSTTAFYAPASYFDRTYTNTQSAALPGFSFVYSNDTGMFEAGSAGSHALGFSTAGTERVRILSDGSVGIGLNNPSEKLEVSGKVKATELCIGADCRAAWPTGSGGTVTSVTSANADIAVATTTTTPVLTLNTGTGANQILKLNGSSEIPVVSGANLTNLNAGNISSGTLPITRGGTAATSFGANKIVSTNGTGTAFASWSCALNEVIKFDGSGNAGCATVATLLGYTPANGTNYVAKAGDTMTGTLNLPSNGLAVGTTQLVVSGGNVGVGTASPATKLDVNGITSSGRLNLTEDVVASGGHSINLNRANNTTQALIGWNKNGTQQFNFGQFATSDNFGFNAYAGGNFLFNGGNVGIGTTSPGQQLSVAGVIESTTGGIKFPDGTIQTTSAVSGTNNTIASGFADVLKCTVTSPNYGTRILFMNSGPANDGRYYYMEPYADASAFPAWVAYNADGSYYANGSAYTTHNCSVSMSALYAAGRAFNIVKGPAGQWLQSGSNAYYNAGNVGIGTSAPLRQIHINGAGSEASIVMSRSDGLANNKNWRIMSQNTGAGTAASLIFDLLNDAGSGVTTTAMTLQSNGNLSLGTPGSRVEVPDNGAVKVGHAYLSSGANGGYAHLSNYEYYNGSTWTNPTGNPGALLQLTGQTFAFYKHNGANTHYSLMTIDASGNVGAAGTYTTFSDRRLKKDIQRIPSSLQKLEAVEGVTYHWRPEHSDDKNRQMGVIAQDVEKVFPEAVRTNKDGVKSVVYDSLVAPVINAIKELYGLWKVDHQRLNQLELENQQMKAYLCQKDPAAPFCR